MTSADIWVDRELRRLRFGAFLERAAEWLAAFLFVFGGAVLVVKLAVPSLWPHILWSGLLALPVLAGAWWRSGRNRWTRSEAVALLDRRLELGGLLMTLSEAPDDEWSRRLPGVEAKWREALPRVRPVRFARWIAMPVLFAAATGFVPLRDFDEPPTILNASRERATERLEFMLERLSEVSALDEKDREELREEIAKLEEETKEGPLTHEKWETIDALEKRMRIRLDAATMQANQARDAAAALADAAGADGQPLTLERQERLEKELIETLKKMAENGAFKNAGEGLKNELQRLTKSGNPRLPQDAAERQKLLDELREHLDRESEKLAEARAQCQGGNCPGGTCSHCGGDGHGEDGADCPHCEGTGQSGREQDGNRPGRGGVNRGRGDAELTYGDESDEKNTRFKETILPPGFLDQPKDDILGLRAVEPEVNETGSTARGTARELGPATGSETSGTELRPRHRQVVKRYFGSGD
ncbi:MAG: hypothetical protein WD066_08080 [Planctomycetaceae bacterium]